MTDTPKTYKLKSRGATDLPKRVRLVGHVGREFILTDAEGFGGNFTLNATQFAELYGGDPTLPDDEQTILNRAAAERHAETLRGYRRSSPPPDDIAGIREIAARQGRPTETPEERFEREGE